MARCKVKKYHGDNKATFQCPEGHVFRRCVIPMKGRRRGHSEMSVQVILSWWKSTGVETDCPGCAREEWEKRNGKREG